MFFVESGCVALIVFDMTFALHCLSFWTSSHYGLARSAGIADFLGGGGGRCVFARAVFARFRVDKVLRFV